MANTLRGGKNIYSNNSLQSNWFEERLEPHHQTSAADKGIQMPPGTVKTWSKMSEEVGAHFKDAAGVVATQTSSWMQYQKSDTDMYRTTQGDAHCHPDQQVSVHEAPHKPEEMVQAYREKWTNGDGHRFEKPKRAASPDLRRAEPLARSPLGAS
eukprot:CAMPEP_0204015866 /NCGR_PEP_ID=MMETSP0360-20130528/26355_1 /ASSEMBLY_ACC=CAM_ASM_000342 /TAXON_ID=268821 /ORGANISM="Scrippsiella Hangoei, Strain SHTV-5" /LENGTH=153 /DNA_ID=CAMNT_0050958817 /DNA_START=70 /DNA_END=529 /DNA_ORIENTATION=-